MFASQNHIHILKSQLRSNHPLLSFNKEEKIQTYTGKSKTFSAHGL